MKLKFFTIISVLLLSACGFHLRGQHVLPQALRCMKLESSAPYGDFESTLRQSLSLLGVNVMREGQAPISLHIISTNLFMDVPTIGGSNQARVFVYYYQVNFEVKDSCNRVLISPKIVTTSESIIVNAGTTLEATKQLEILQQQMYKKAAHMIINILNAPQTFRTFGER